MIDAEKIIESLRHRWQAGEPQLKIAKEAGISHAYLCELISGKNDPNGLTIKKINALFPKATLNLHGDAAVISAPRNSGNVIGINHGTMASDCLSGIMDKILSTEELTAEEKVKVLKVLQK